ncbi:hypothetical protein MMC17_007332 [Xylographa soralifera]|nr:hypothetical protein [Xylographa soralifera]
MYRSEDIDQWSSTWEIGEGRRAWQAQLGGYHLQVINSIRPRGRYRTGQPWHNTEHQTTKRARRSLDLGRATYDHLVAFAPWTITLEDDLGK